MASKKNGAGNPKSAKKVANWAKQNLTIPNEEVFCENATIARHHVKKKVIQQELIPYECQRCGNEGER